MRNKRTGSYPIISLIIGTFLAVGMGMTMPAQAFFDPSVEELLEETKITLLEAVSTALREVPGKAYAVELEREEGRVAFEVHIRDHTGKSQEVYVDARTGKIVTTETKRE